MPPGTVSAELLGAELRATWMLVIIRTDASMAIETEWNTVVQRVVPAFGLRNDVVAFNVLAFELVAEAAAPIAKYERFDLYVGRKRQSDLRGA